MRRSAKWFGFVVVASLIVGACGGDDSSTTGNSTTENSTADTSTSDTTADDGDRDRNVKVGGWGTDGSGVASLKVAEESNTSVATKVFRRARTEVVNGKNIRNEQDVFVVTAIQRTVDATDETFFKVQGFTTAGDDPTTYPMANFGTDGVVTVKVPQKNPKWGPMPMSWTMVSRDVLAAYYFNLEDPSGDNGVIEYYDLRSGSLAVSIGQKGRVVLPLDAPMRWINDMAFGGLDDSGLPRMVFSGLNFDANGASIPIVAGITHDGKPDPQIGTDGSGLIDLTDLLMNQETFSVRRVKLADPGLNDGASGLGAVIILDAIAPEDTNKSVEQAMEPVLLGRDKTTGKVSVRGGTTRFSFWQPNGSHVDVRSAVVNDDGALAVHATHTAVGGNYWGEERRNGMFLLSASGAQINEFVMPGWSEEVTTTEDNLPIRDMSSKGAPVVAGSFYDSAASHYESRVCFRLDNCSSPSSTSRIELVSVSPTEGLWPNVNSMVVDGTNVHVTIVNYVQGTGSKLYTLASFDASGAPRGPVSSPLDKRFGSYITTSINEDEVQDEISAPIPLGQGRVYAFHYTPAQLSLRTQTVGAKATDVSVRPPLGISSWIDVDQLVKPLSERHVSMLADVDNGIARVRRVYKVDADNGSIDTTFGTNGYFETVVPTDIDDECGYRFFVLTSAGFLTQVKATSRTAIGGEDYICSDTTTEYLWSTIDATGRAVGKAWAVADATLVPGSWDTSRTTDSRGNLFVSRGYENYDAAGELVSTGTWIGKFTQEGTLDPNFGDKGLLKLDNVWGSELATDSEGRLYVATIGNGNTLEVYRYTTAGVLDAAVDAPALAEVPQPSKGNAAAAAREAARTRADEEEKNVETERSSSHPESGLTVTTDKPVVTSVTAVEDRSLTVAWALSASVGNVFVTATANPGGRSCTSDTGSCVIRGLDPSEIYTITLAKKGDEPQPATVATATKPVVSLKIGRVASPTTFVRPASKGKATWKVRGGCTLNETNTRITAPKRATTCQLSVTTAKSGSTPKTTKSVTIVVTK